ncbi:MAG: RibD family protein [Spirochaetia bacterium]|nr:RibD family protein [Spirochaetia bacterium]
MNKKNIIKINMAQSINGCTIQINGKWQTTSNEDKRRMQKLRKWADCIIVSRKTLLSDNANLLAEPKMSSQNPRPVIILQDTQKKIPNSLNVFSKPHPKGEIWINEKFNKENNINSNENFLEFQNLGWQIFSFSSFKEIIQSLSKRNFQNILIEGGGRLNGLFLKENLVDEIYTTIVPFIFGNKNNDRILVIEEEFISQFKLINTERRKNEIYLRYIKKLSQ